MEKALGKIKNVLGLSILLSALIIFAGCKTVPSTPSATPDLSQALPLELLCPSNLTWAQLEDKKGTPLEGFQVMNHKVKELNARWTCIKADLTTPGLKVVATPTPDQLGQSPKLQYVKTFAKNNNTIVAVNATPWENKSFPHNAVGIVKIDGIEYFPPVEYYSALCFTEEPLRAVIIENQKKEEIEKYSNAFGGFYQVLKNGELIPFNNNRRSRVSVGVNKDGTELYFFVVTSIMKPRDRAGFTFEECGIVLQKLGCTDAMHFDGGHSSCLVINANQSQKPLLNRKIPIAIGLKK